MIKKVGYLICSLLITLVGCLQMIGCSQPAHSKNTIEVWHWLTDRQDALDALAVKFEKETGVKVKFELFSALFFNIPYLFRCFSGLDKDSIDFVTYWEVFLQYLLI